MKAKLTQKGLTSILKGQTGKALYVWDTDLSGFGAYVSPKGDVSFLVQKWVGGRDGKAIRYVIGKTKDGMKLDAARTLAASHIGDIAKGENPVEVRRRARSDIRQSLNGINVSDALDRFIPEGTNSRYKASVRRSLRAAFQSEGLLKAKVSEITRADVRRMIAKKEGRPAAARNLFAALRPFFQFCIQEDIIRSSPTTDIQAPSPSKSRDRFLSPAEIKAFWKATEGVTYRDFYRLLLLTAQRREEVAGMRWEELDLSEKTWTIPSDRAKNGRAHVVHLSDDAVSILSGLTPEEKKANGSEASSMRKGYVFPSRRGPETHISGFSKMKREIDKKMAEELQGELQPWRIHDIRRTVASGLAEMGFPTDVADRLLNHVSGSQSGVKGVYQRYSFMKERKEAIEAWAEKVREITS